MATTFNVGQTVKIANYSKKNLQWIIGTIIMVSADSPCIYWVQLPTGRSRIHAEYIRAYVSDSQIYEYIKKIGDQDKADCIE